MVYLFTDSLHPSYDKMRSHVEGEITDQVDVWRVIVPTFFGFIGKRLVEVVGHDVPEI